MNEIDTLRRVSPSLFRTSLISFAFVRVPPPIALCRIYYQRKSFQLSQTMRKVEHLLFNYSKIIRKLFCIVAARIASNDQSGKKTLLNIKKKEQILVIVC